MKDMFGREISVGMTVAYSGKSAGLSFYQIEKVMPPNHKTSTGATGRRYQFSKASPDGFALHSKAVALLDDYSRYWIVSTDSLPIYHNKPV